MKNCRGRVTLITRDLNSESVRGFFSTRQFLLVSTTHTHTHRHIHSSYCLQHTHTRCLQHTHSSYCLQHVHLSTTHTHTCCLQHIRTHSSVWPCFTFSLCLPLSCLNPPGLPSPSCASSLRPFSRTAAPSFLFRLTIQGWKQSLLSLVTSQPSLSLTPIVLNSCLSIPSASYFLRFPMYMFILSALNGLAGLGGLRF